jgi:pimeloyl-ACP methyl ester carboxylesterase
MCLVLARGYAIAVTDYQGLGTPGDHAYMVGRVLGMNVLDAMRCARALEPHELPGDGSAGVIGYSEGGAAAAWAAQLQPEYAPEVALAGVPARASAGPSSRFSSPTAGSASPPPTPSSSSTAT